ncbi:MAG: aldose epimerase [Cyanobacteria bacterium P01_F01_bin.150]
MFEIALEQNQYKTYSLVNKVTHSSMTIIPERGGIVTSWVVNGQEVFYLDQERFKNAALSVRGGIPLLFPICGNLPNDTYAYQAQTYQLKQHGFGRTSPWDVTHQSTLENEARLTITLKSNEATQAVYPFEFALDYTYVLKDNVLELHQRHTNLSDRPMPFSTGIHPYFSVQDKSKLTFDIPANQYQIKGAAERHSFDGSFDFSQDEIDFSFVELQGTTSTVIDNGSNRKLTLEFDSKYSTLVFWTLADKAFYCLEPWTGPRNAINTGKDLLTIAPGKTVETKVIMRIDSLA